jgi:hypothetical protein
MTGTDALRDEIIGKLLTISDQSFLSAINRIVDESRSTLEPVKLSAEQKLMLELSDEDIRHGRTSTQDELHKEDMQWLKEL